MRAGLEEMGEGRDEVRRLEDPWPIADCSSPPSVTVEALKRPEWAAEHEQRRTLVTLTLIGSWSSTNAADRTAIEQLAKGGRTRYRARRQFPAGAMTPSVGYRLASRRGLED